MTELLCLLFMYLGRKFTSTILSRHNPTDIIVKNKAIIRQFILLFTSHKIQSVPFILLLSTVAYFIESLNLPGYGLTNVVFRDTL